MRSLKKCDQREQGGHTHSTDEAAKCQLDIDERHEWRNVVLSESLVLSCPKSTAASIFQSQTRRI